MKHIIIFLSLLLLSTGCTQINKTQVESNIITGDNKSTTEVIQTEDIGYMLSQIPEKYTKNEDFKMCLKSNVDICIQDTYMGKDLSTMNCDDFLLDVNKDSCIQSQTIIKAVKQQDMSICTSLDLEEENCKYEVAVTLGMINYDTEVCSTINKAYRVSCNNKIVISESQEKRDVNICDKLIGENDILDSEKQFCIEEVGYLIEEDKRIEAIENEQARIKNEELKNQDDFKIIE